MLSLAEISDRLEIQQLLVDYSTAIDQRRFDDLDKVFTPDAYIDYRALGGIDGRYPEVKKWLSEVLPNFPVYAHMLGNFSVRDRRRHRVVAGDLLQPDGASPATKDQVLFCGLWYDDEFVRTPEGWRMTRRVETKIFQKVHVTPRTTCRDFCRGPLVLAQWAAVRRATRPHRVLARPVTHARQNRVRASCPGR